MAAWLGWQAMLALVRTTFPETQHVSTDELASAIAAQDVAVLLLDVRRREEYEVSHLEGAVWVGEDGEHPELAAMVSAFAEEHEPARTLVACYCSVGYRSSRLARRLASELGLRAVNVEGSLFRWVNEGRPVFRGSERLDPALAHPYNSVFGKLLHADKRSPLSLLSSA